MQRIKELNLLRGFAILGVILIHVTASFTNSNVNSLLIKSNAVIDIYTHYAVPLFILLSGLVLGVHYKDNYNLKKFYYKRFNKVFFPYLTFSILYLPLQISRQIYVNGIGSVSITRIVFWFVSAETFYHLWFFVLIFQLYILYPIIRKLIKNKSIHFVIAILIIQIGYNYINDDISQNKYINFVFNRLFLTHLFYFIFGIWIADNYDKTKNFLEKINKKNQGLIFIVTAVLSIIFSYNWLSKYNGFYVKNNYLLLFESLLTPIMYLLIFITLYKLSKLIVSSKSKTNYFMNKLGKYSFGIYLIHAGVLFVIQNIFELTGLYVNNIYYYIFSFLITLFLSITFCDLVKKTNYSKFIIGF